ncbi:polygalacturonase-like [Heracleum sosnowskyi]|uniref:Polygalacturonase-like n=1 Tax=Heracleum sosnowskyi TaxID=360622 RepID=A0AAD8MIR4_9APIA|nr:polygalacturonase-like [Heracleum sosnowskyi]
MPLKRNLDVQGAIHGAWLMVLLFSCVVDAHQFDDTFDPITRRALVAGTQGRGGGHPIDPGHPADPAPGHPAPGHPAPGPNYKVVDISRFPPAKGDGKTDSTPGIMKAWDEVCNCSAPSKLLIPKGTWLAAELEFRGPCASPQIMIEIQGVLLGKPDKQAFPRGRWINIIKIHRVIVTGGGTINAQGEKTWHTRGIGESGKPLADTFVLAQCNHSRVENINLVNGKGFNMKVFEAEDVTISNLHITAPDESPNTDGIHIGRIKDVKIFDSVIGTGDDCISIGDGSIDIHVKNVMCGPGHGISIGSLGRFQYETDVRNILIENCTFIRTQNGARIKTFHDSPAIAAHNITYCNLNMIDVYNPIIIDQNYAVNKKTPSKVKLSDIKFRNIRGTTWSNIAINLNCSSTVPCQGVELFDVDLRYTGNNTVDRITHSACTHANAKFGGIMVPPPCKQ